MARCRSCLSAEINLMQMDVVFIQNFNLLTGLNLSMIEKSLYTCQICIDAVTFCINFRNKCIESDLRFQQMCIPISLTQDIKHDSAFASDKNVYVTSHIKQEIKLDKEHFVNVSTLDNDDNDECVTETENTYFTNKRKSVSKKRKISDCKVLKENIKKIKLSTDEISGRVKEKNAESNLQCGLCDSKFHDIHHLRNHLKYHMSSFKTQISCGLCPERFLNLPHMLGHRLEHVSEDQRICHICSKKFLVSSSTCLEFHYMRAHNMAEKDAQIQCKQCPSSYATSRKLIRHVRDCHSAPRYECRLCKKSFRNKTLLNVHNKMQHTETKTVKCELCDFSSKYANSLLLHTRRKHTSNTFNCKACYRVFLDQESLTRHVNDVCKHHTRVVCAVCGYTVKKVWLKHHMRSHSDEYPFKCDRCPAQYKYRTGLKDHTDKHKGTLSFHCDLCSKSFCIKSALQSHKRTHAGDKPFICAICNVGFKRRFNLKAHMNAHPLSAPSELTDG